MPRKRKSVDVATHWQPLELYSHQSDVIQAHLNGFTRYFLAWHRRAGKDVFSLDFARDRAFERVGTYWHLFPFHVQARRAIWKGIDARTGQRFILRAFPEEIISSVNDTEMSITFNNGSVWQMLGSDNYDRHIGSNPCGLVFSEWALCDPAAWEYLRPILVENKGWAMFITTFRGCNHAWRMYQNVKDSEGWFTSLRTIADTKRNNGSPIISDADVQQEISEGMDSALAEQEFYCNPSAAISGAIFTRQHARLSTIPCTVVDAATNRVLRVAWGAYEQGIAAVVFQDRTIYAVHTFCESNYVDAVQTVTRRHAHVPLVHYAISPDIQLFNSLDGAGVVPARITESDVHANHGHVAAILNTCSATAVAKEVLTDFAMAYAPYRVTNDNLDLTHSALCEALAITHAAQPSLRVPARAPLDYSRYDRGVI